MRSQGSVAMIVLLAGIAVLLAIVPLPFWLDVLRPAFPALMVLYFSTMAPYTGGIALAFFPGLALESVHWLADKGIGMFGVEAVSPAPEGELNFQAHMACAERGITHMECLANLDKLIGRGRFRFIGFPLKIRGGTASPIRAVAVFE